MNATQLALSDAAEWLGDWHPLAEQLGSAEGFMEFGSVATLLQLPPVQDRLSLERFLRGYLSQILLPVELPAIQRSYEHTARHELRELIEFDRTLEQAPALAAFASASRRVGQTQLRRLRPLRDQRMVQRYLQAVESGQANGWHTLVYGLTLELYSLPLRQGLLGYAHHVVRGLIYAAARPLLLSEHNCRQLFDDLCADLPAAVHGLLKETLAA